MPAARSCDHCGGELPGASRYCPHCGMRVAEEERVTEIAPAQETAAEAPRLYGVTPPLAGLTLAAATVVLGIVLLALGYGLAGLLVTLAALAGLAWFLVLEARKAETRVGRALARGRARARAEATLLSARIAARRRRARLRAELARLGRERTTRLGALGAAVYGGDVAATERERTALEELDGTIATREAEMAAVPTELTKRIREARLDAQPTMVEVPDVPGPDPAPPSDPPEPARIPEPFPPPDEGDPPEPARLPEPYPPPDEGDIPEPDPSPDDGR